MALLDQQRKTQLGSEMQTWIALLRGINVGGNNLLPMKELVCELEQLNFSDVTTYIQSGNVVFRSKKKSGPKIAKDIQNRIKQSHGFEPRVVVLSSIQLEEAINSNPFPDAVSDPKSLHLSFLETKPTKPKWDSIENAKQESESFELVGNVFYLHAPDGIGRSKLAANIEKHLGVAATGRNWRTVTKMSTLVADVEAR